MPTVGSLQLPPPKSWDEFEEMCADLFSREWNDRNVIRYGRQGQRQNGVDIYGSPNDEEHAGVQCKVKRIYPLTNLTTDEIDAEVEKAFEFRPQLTEFIFATTALDDIALQDHALKITERHKEEGLFSVHIFGWNELIRRLTCYTDLIVKYYGFISNNKILEEITLIRKKLDDTTTAGSTIPVGLIDNEISKLVENIKKKRFFDGPISATDAIILSEQIESGKFQNGSNDKKLFALAWCARVLSNTDSGKAKEILSYASQYGHCEEIDIATSFISAAQDKLNDALNILARISTTAAKTAAFMIIANRQGAKEAFNWLDKTKITFSDLDSDGKVAFLSRCIELEEWSILLEHANTLTDHDYSQTPMLIFLSAIANLYQVVPPELRRFIWGQVPLEVNEFPLASDSKAISFIQKARALFERCAIVVEDLGLEKFANVAADYALWLELKDPEQKEVAIEKLRESMRDPNHYLRRLNFAWQFGIKLNIEAVNQEIERQNALTGGNSIEAAYARFVLAYIQKTPGNAADYINRYRDEISRYIDRIVLSSIEVQMLARAGRIEDAEKRLEELQKNGIDKETKKKLELIISEAKGNDPIKAWTEEFQRDQSIRSLANLVNVLEAHKDWKRLCHYGSLLFNMTHTVKDAERLAIALNNNNQFTDLAQLLSNYPEFRKQSDNLQSLWCWVFYREGAVKESAICLSELRAKRDDQNDRILAIDLAVASGNWEDLTKIIEEEWENRDSRTAPELLRAAQFAQIIGSPRTKNLVQSAIKKANNDSNVYLSAYLIATNGGWENEPEAIDWLPKAVEHSGLDGPVKRMSLKDLLEYKPDWDRKESDIRQKLNNGELPIVGAAILLNRSFVELFLLPALANINEPDPRRRINVYAYSGTRQQLVIDIKRIGLDATSLLTLTILGVLKETIDSFNEIIIPHSTLGWLFEEKKRIKFHQPSIISNAKELRQLLDDGALKYFVGIATVDSDLAAEVGEELAAFISEVKAVKENDQKQRIVVRSYPVHRIDSLMDEEADLSRYKNYLCSCTKVIEKLKQKGQITATEEKKALAYFSTIEKRWPEEPEIEDGAILFIDDLSIKYFQHLGLLRKFNAAGLTAIVSKIEINETKALIRYEKLTDDASKKIDELRITLAEGIRSGKIKLGPFPSLQGDEQIQFRLHPTVSIIDIAKLTDAIVVDDRYMNRHHNIDVESREIPILTSWDLLTNLNSLGKLELNTLFEHRTMLRRAGFLLMPIDEKEINHHLNSALIIEGVLQESAELKAIRENILQTRMTNTLVLPNEANWLDSLMQVMRRVFKSQWTPEIDDDTARARSNWLIQFLDLRSWSSALGQEGGSRIALNGYEATIMLLLAPPEKSSIEVIERYWHWIEDTIIKQLKNENPDVLSKVVQHTKKLIADVIKMNDTKETG